MSPVTVLCYLNGHALILLLVKLFVFMSYVSYYLTFRQWVLTHSLDLMRSVMGIHTF